MHYRRSMEGVPGTATLGLMERAPRILGVQAEGAAPVPRRASRAAGRSKPVEARTIADSIAVGVPRNWRKAVMAVKEAGGAMINVSDGEILDAMRYTGRLAGIFAEPAAAAAVAGLRRAAASGLGGAASNRGGADHGQRAEGCRIGACGGGLAVRGYRRKGRSWRRFSDSER